MKKFPHIFALLLALTLLCVLTACGSHKASEPVRKDNDDGSWSIYEYDTNERVTTWTSYNPNGSVYFVHEYSYDEQGARTSALRTYPDSDREQEFTYDEQGRSIKEVTIYSNGNVDTTEYRYSDGEVTIDCSATYDGGVATGSYTHTLSNPEYSVSFYACAYNIDTGTVYYILFDEIDAKGNKVSTIYGEL